MSSTIGILDCLTWKQGSKCQKYMFLGIPEVSILNVSLKQIWQCFWFHCSFNKFVPKYISMGTDFYFWKFALCDHVYLYWRCWVWCMLQPGLTGGSGDTYVRHMLLRARSKQWRVVVFNSRGCGDSPVTTPQVLLFVSRCANFWTILRFMFMLSIWSSEIL